MHTESKSGFRWDAQGTGLFVLIIIMKTSEMASVLFCIYLSLSPIVVGIAVYILLSNLKHKFNVHTVNA